MRDIAASGKAVAIGPTLTPGPGWIGQTNPFSYVEKGRGGTVYPDSSFIYYNPGLGMPIWNWKTLTVYELDDGTSVMAHEISHAWDNATHDHKVGDETRARLRENEIRTLQGVPPVPQGQ